MSIGHHHQPSAEEEKASKHDSGDYVVEFFRETTDEVRQLACLLKERSERRRNRRPDS